MDLARKNRHHFQGRERWGQSYQHLTGGARGTAQHPGTQSSPHPREAQGPSVDGAELEKPRYKLCSCETAAEVCHPRKDPVGDPNGQDELSRRVWDGQKLP